jgi:hypothetical protein
MERVMMFAEHSLAQRLYGTDQALPEVLSVSVAGLEFRVEGPQLRGLRVAGTEVLRNVGLVVRDEFWGTHSLQQRGGEIQSSERQWRQIISGVVSPQGQAPVLDWQVDMQVSEQGVSIAARLQALEDFTTCRAGLMLLHPLKGVVGAAVSVTHGDGRIEHSAFPDLIAPAQPFFDIQRLVHSPIEGLTLQWDFSGDVFEMEDQRNWSDASFKTYNRPLAWPCPYRLSKGQVVEQRITLTLISTDSISTEGKRP